MNQFEELKAAVRNGLAVQTHSGRVQPGDVFVALSGSREDGIRFIPEALANGAEFVVAARSDGWPVGASAQLIMHPDPRLALGELAAARFGTERLAFPLVGITGTNGKTTTSYLLEHLFRENGRNPGVLGTVSYRWPGVEIPAPLTTPDCLQLHELISKMAAADVGAVVMEVSSHALDQERVAGLRFPYAVLTNVTQDHLDYHGDMDAYFRAKARLFSRDGAGATLGIVNWDDPYGRVVLGNHEPCLGYGIREENPLAGKGVPGLKGQIEECTVQGLALRMRYNDTTWTLRSPLVGRFNAYNLLAAQAVGLAMGMKPKHLRALESFSGVPGRLERIPNSRGLDVFVDYAHTPDALENVLSSLKELQFKRLIVVFGCGGNRDRAKRPLMGEAVARYAGVAVLTSDNPRHERSTAIMDDVRPGLARCPMVIESPDRRKAIMLALEEMRLGDVLVVAGKGHETYQQIGDEKNPFSDQQVVRELLS